MRCLSQVIDLPWEQLQIDSEEHYIAIREQDGNKVPKRKSFSVSTRYGYLQVATEHSLSAWTWGCMRASWNFSYRLRQSKTLHRDDTLKSCLSPMKHDEWVCWQDILSSLAWQDIAAPSVVFKCQEKVILDVKSFVLGAVFKISAWRLQALL